jgi:glycosyltransferase involved in cell wall biosynthesis
VVIPTYNRADFLVGTLASVLDQTLPPAEVIVVDDGSTDETEQVVRSFPPPVKYVRIENSGVCRARNVGADHATTAWIAYCDSDDLWHPHKLAAQASLLNAVPDLEVGFTNFSVVTGNSWSTGTKFDEAPPGFWDIPRREMGPGVFVLDASLYERLLCYQPIFPSTLILSQAFFRRVGRWVEALGRTLSEDLEFILRCVNQPPIGVVSAPLVGIRKHPGGFSSRPLRTLQGEITILHYVLEHHPSAREHERAIRNSIVERSAAGADLAFLAGDLDRFQEFLRAVPRERRSRALRTKSLIAQLPSPLARVVRGASLAMAARHRRNRMRS